MSRFAWPREVITEPLASSICSLPRWLSIMIFALFVFPLLGRVVTPAMNMAKAIVFALVLATLSAGFLVPYVYYPHLGAGAFGSGFGWKLTFAIYLWHLIFGVNLGMMYNPLPLSDPEFNQTEAVA